MIKIGTASYDSDNSGTIDDDEYYNLIYHADAPFGPIVWLDYTHSGTWSEITSWAVGLDSALTYTLDSGYSVNWGDSSWRLPRTVDGEVVEGYDGTTTAGYNITSSDMGHLFYTELGNKGKYAIDGTENSSPYGLTNTGDFNNLIKSESYYRSGTLCLLGGGSAWAFDMDFVNSGHQKVIGSGTNIWGLAVRSGEVSVVPEPTTMLLFGVGLLGIAGVSRKRNKSAPHIA